MITPEQSARNQLDTLQRTIEDRNLTASQDLFVQSALLLVQDAAISEMYPASMLASLRVLRTYDVLVAAVEEADRNRLFKPDTIDKRHPSRNLNADWEKIEAIAKACLNRINNIRS